MLKAENDRFKAALEVIAAMTEPPYISAPGIAKAALNWGDEMRHTKERGYNVTLTIRLAIQHGQDLLRDPGILLGLRESAHSLRVHRRHCKILISDQSVL